MKPINLHFPIAIISIFVSVSLHAKSYSQYTLDGCFTQVSIVSSISDGFPLELSGLPCEEAVDAILYNEYVKTASCPLIDPIPCPTPDVTFCCIRLVEIMPWDPIYPIAPFAIISGVSPNKKFKLEYMLMECKDIE